VCRAQPAGVPRASQTEVSQPIAVAVTNADTCFRWLTCDQPDLDAARAAASRIVKDATRAAEISQRRATAPGELFCLERDKVKGSSLNFEQVSEPDSAHRSKGFVLSSGNVSSSGRVDLSVQVGALRLPNPILAASGTFGYGLEFAPLVDFNRIGGFVTKGISQEPIEGAPSPRLSETPSGMLNAVGLQNVGVEAFASGKLPLLRKYNTTVIVNVFGYCLEEYVSVIQRLEDAEGIAAYELNISCPNVKKGGMQFGSSPALVEEVVKAARSVAMKRPLWVKLMPLVTDIGLIAKSAESAGADALTVANTYPAMSVDFRTGKSKLGNLTGGLSGPAIRPITLKLVWEAKNAVKIPIVALGGIEKVDDILEYLAVGASAVQVGTASFTDPAISEELATGLAQAMNDAKMLTISELRDKIAVKFG
jgi:dihydroorotate dehydrogenase (NAD+) catalytic subunit